MACHALSFADDGCCSSPTGHWQYTAIKHLHLLMQLGISLVRQPAAGFASFGAASQHGYAAGVLTELSCLWLAPCAACRSWG
jgi:hypothetical protein